MCWPPVREMPARRWKLLSPLPPTLAASRRWRSCSAAERRYRIHSAGRELFVGAGDRSVGAAAGVLFVHSRVGTPRPVKDRRVTNGLADARRTVHPCKHFADAVSMPVAQRARTNTVSQPFPFPNQEIKRKLPLYVVGNNRSLMIEPQICLRFGPGDYTRRQQGAHGWRLGCPDNSA